MNEYERTCGYPSPLIECGSTQHYLNNFSVGKLDPMITLIESNSNEILISPISNNKYLSLKEKGIKEKKLTESRKVPKNFMSELIKTADCLYPSFEAFEDSDGGDCLKLSAQIERLKNKRREAISNSDKIKALKIEYKLKLLEVEKWEQIQNDEDENDEEDEDEDLNDLNSDSEEEEKKLYRQPLRRASTIANKRPSEQ